MTGVPQQGQAEGQAQGQGLAEAQILSVPGNVITPRVRHVCLRHKPLLGCHNKPCGPYVDQCVEHVYHEQGQGMCAKTWPAHSLLDEEGQGIRLSNMLTVAFPVCTCWALLCDWRLLACERFCFLFVSWLLVCCSTYLQCYTNV